MASFQEIPRMDAVCDRSHKHFGWGITTNDVWARSVESQYPRKLCIVLCKLCCRSSFATPKLHDLADHSLLSTKQSQLATGLQPKGNKILPLVPDFQQTATFFPKEASDISCVDWKTEHSFQQCKKELKCRRSMPDFCVALLTPTLTRGHANSRIFFPHNASSLPPGRSTRSIACCNNS